MSQILLPDYDFEEAFWNWSENHLQATVSFQDKNGGEPLYVDATVTRKITEATCEEDGVAVYTAKATYEGKTFTQKESVVIDAPGHSYEGTVHDDGHITYVCSVCGDTYTDEE